MPSMAQMKGLGNVQRDGWRILSRGHGPVGGPLALWRGEDIAYLLPNGRLVNLSELFRVASNLHHSEFDSEKFKALSNAVEGRDVAG